MGRTIKNFEVLEQIGQGGTATIYKGIQKSLDRYVVIKELHPHLVNNENFIARFEREAKASALLNHENIVQIIDFGKEGESYFIALEFIDGMSLKELKDKSSTYPLEITLYLIAEICKGLEHAHEKGIIHRDIKPGNVMLSSEGKVKITDFGLAQAKQFNSVTVTGSLIGTPAYMSPEQAAGKKVDQQTDIFSLGVMFYEMATGQKPFDGENYTSVITKILSYKPKHTFEISGSIPKEINDMIMRSLEKDVEKRYPTVAELLADIQKFMEKHNLFFTSKDLQKFLKDPDGYTSKLKEKQAKDHIAKGMYYMNIGGEKIDDAIKEFDMALTIDPENEDIKDKIRELQKQREEIAKKSVAPKVKVSSGPAPQSQVQKIPVKKKSKFPIFLIIGFLFIAVVIVAGVLIVVLDPFNLNLLNPQPVVAPGPGPTPVPDPVPIPQPVTTNEYLTPGPNKGEVWIISNPSGGSIYIDNTDTGIKAPCKVYLPINKDVTIKVTMYPNYIGVQRTKITKKEKNDPIKIKLEKSN
ncbi:MAG TPA: serine/threonine protein kinase [Firmicutes bacterium]|nr:serine/threonine protein kinase [Bacillota bacterium]